MTTATVAFAFFPCVCLYTNAQREATPVFACHLKAIPAADRPCYRELLRSIRTAMRDRIEISNGYVFKLDSKAMGLHEAAECISMERLCCPFLLLQVSASGNQAYWLSDADRPGRSEAATQNRVPCPLMTGAHAHHIGFTPHYGEQRKFMRDNGLLANLLVCSLILGRIS
jgi:hypothetical protein